MFSPSCIFFCSGLKTIQSCCFLPQHHFSILSNPTLRIQATSHLAHNPVIYVNMMLHYSFATNFPFRHKLQYVAFQQLKRYILVCVGYKKAKSEAKKDFMKTHSVIRDPIIVIIAVTFIT